MVPETPIRAAKMATMFERFGGNFCKALLLITGLVFYLIYALLSSYPCCRSPDLFLNHHKLVANTARPHQPSSSGSGAMVVRINSTLTNINHLVFGIAGSANTWRNRGPYIDLWWRPNDTRGFVWLDRAPTTEYSWPSTSPPFRVSEDTTARFKDYAKHGMPFAIRMTRVILESFRVLGMEDVRWFVMADDDTVLFLDNLVEVLGRYDHNGYYYIGAASECVSQNFGNSFSMAFGGAGYAVSYRLVKALSSTKFLDGCLRRYPTLYGSDHILQYCMAELGVSLTREPGFHQIDLRGDISGFLSAHPQAPLLSFHHLDSIDPIFPSMTRHESLRHLMKAATVDSSRLLQQTICYAKQTNWSFSISWGYSVQIFEKIHPPGLLQIPIQTFRTWNNKWNPTFMFNVRPMSNDPCVAPHLFYFESVGSKSQDLIVTNYVRRMSRQLPACGNHSADSISRIQVFSPNKRLQWDGRRRECCEIIPLSSANVTEVRIRTCLENEALE